MREILFRGKRVDTGEWVYGFFIGGDIFNPLKLITYSNCHAGVSVIPETVGQYITTTDDQRIFEGDKIDVHHHGKDGMFCRSFIVADIRTLNYEFAKDGHGDTWHVIGNIHTKEA